MTGLRVLHVLDHSLPLHSGYTFRTLSILREQRKLGWETFHLTGCKQGVAAGQEVVDDWLFYRTAPIADVTGRVPGVAEWQMMRRLGERIEQVARNVRPDIIHAHSPVLDALPALRAGRRLGIPVTYEVRAFWEDAAVDHGTTREGSLRYRLTRAAETHALKRAAHVFTICEGLRRDIVARGIAPDRVTVIPNAVDIDAFDPGGVPDAALLARLGLAGCSVVGFIGSFYAYEGLDLLLQALPKLLAARTEVRVLLVGGGPQERALKALAERLGIADRVVFAGRVPHREVPAYYDLIDVLAYPRRSMRLTELVTPLKPLEAMAQGRLLVASDVGGHRELIEDGVTGRLFAAGDAASLADALLRALADPQERQRMTLAARRHVGAERSWTRSVERYRSAYDRVIAAAPTRAAERSREPAHGG